MEDKIILYTINCPKCKVLELKLKQKNLSYSTVDNAEEVVKIGKLHNINSAPFIYVNDTFLDFSQAIKFINERK